MPYNIIYKCYFCKPGLATLLSFTGIFPPKLLGIALYTIETNLNIVEPSSLEVQIEFLVLLIL